MHLKILPLLPLLVLLLLSTPVHADIATFIKKAQADAAVSTLRSVTHVAHYCAPCSDGDVRVETVNSVSAQPSTIPEFWTVKLNGKDLDLAYVYVNSDSSWKNLAAELQIPIGDIPRTLPSNLAPNLNSQRPPRARSTASPSGLQWMPVVEMDNQIFPAFYLATATQPIIESQVPGVIGDAQGKVGFHIVNPRANTRVRLQFEIEPVIKLQTFEATLSEQGKYYQIYPKIVWNWEALKRYKRPSPANARFSLYIDGQLVETKTIVVRVRSVNEAVYSYSYLLDENRWANTGWLFAAYVNEDHEWIDQILKEALHSKFVNSFTGYQTRKQQEVLNQVFAIWYVLQKRGFRYSSITNTSGTGTTTKVFSQYVRTIEESINAAQANCVDGSVLIASILKKIGIKVGLVLIPGHCFLVFDLDGNGNWQGLETTMMGNTDLQRFSDEAGRTKAAIEGFVNAVSVGNKSLSDSASKINNGDPQFKLIKIDDARRSGIFPLSF